MEQWAQNQIWVDQAMEWEFLHMSMSNVVYHPPHVVMVNSTSNKNVVLILWKCLYILSIDQWAQN